MDRVRAVVGALFALSPEGRSFFWITVLAHVALKVLLGLFLVIEDRYGFRTLLAPPLSLVFAGGDVAVCFLVAKAIDWTVRGAARRLVQNLLLLPLFVFLVTNFIVHTYFKAFVNRGLLEFNGAGAIEISDYTIAGLNAYSITFIVTTGAGFVALALHRSRIERAWLVASARGPFAALCLGVLAMLYTSKLSQGQSGFMAKTPTFEFVRSWVIGNRAATRRATPEEVRAFQDPRAPIHGRHDTALDVTVPPRPGANVLFVLVESLPFEQIALGGADGQFEVLSELARDGVAFTNFRTVFPATSRSLLTYLCGIYPNTGLATPTKYVPAYRCSSLLGLLKANGYRTGFFTASMFTYDNMHKSALMSEYDEYQDFLSLHEHARNDRVDAPAVEEEAVAASLLKFLRRDRSKPFFATYFMFWNHAPYRLPFEDIGHLPPLERYRRGLAYLDRVLRDLLAEMRKEGLLDDTLVVVSADHGEGFGLHHANFDHVGHIWEDDVRVPFIVHVSGLGPYTTARQGSNADFASTVAGLLGLRADPTWQGQDLLSPRYEPRPTLLFGRAANATNGIVDGHFKYIEYTDGSARGLYDLSVDPHEQTNLLATHPGIAEDYRKLVSAWLPVAEARAWAVHER